MKLLPHRLALLCAVVLTVAAPMRLLADIALKIIPDKSSGVYTPGEKVTWTIDLKQRDPAVPAPELTYKIKKDGQVQIADGKLNLSAGPVTLTATRDDPGVILAQIFEPSKPLPIGVGGAIFSPEKITPSAPEPKDFDVFWRAKLGELAKVPANPVLEKVAGIKNAETIDYYKVTLDNIRGTHVRGQLARPASEGKYPAILVLQFAGVYGLDTNTVTTDAKAGWLALNISAHDLPIDESPEFYKNLKDGALKNYIYIGSEDRDASYFLRMFLGCVRAAEYLTSRPDWDGKTLLVTGASQGGLQSFATAALFPKVTGMLTVVPAGCDVYAPLANRAFGWPYWLSNWGPHDRDMKKVETTAGYFDPINFAARIHCPALVGYGLIDDTARPTGIAAAINTLKGPKEPVILPLSNHYGTGGAQGPYFSRAAAWKKAALAGGTLPPVLAPKP